MFSCPKRSCDWTCDYCKEFARRMRDGSTDTVNRVLADLDWAHDTAAELKAWREYQDFMDAADQAAYYSPKWEENR